jgi:hypothetical protein
LRIVDGGRADWKDISGLVLNLQFEIRRYGASPAVNHFH